MTLTAHMVEQLAEWCLRSDTLADDRATARKDFSGMMNRAKPAIWKAPTASPAGNDASWVGLRSALNYQMDVALRRLPQFLSSVVMT